MGNDPGRFRILVVDDEQEIVRDLIDLLQEEGYRAQGASTGQEAISLLDAERFDLVISDLRMPPPDGLELVRWAKEHRPETPVIILTAHAEPALARNAVQSGAHDYVTKPWNTFELLLRVRRVQERWDLMGRTDRLRRYIEHLTGDSGEESSLEQLVGRSHGMKEVFELARRVAPTDATVLLRGESGTGKTALAASIHRMSPRGHHPFVKVNCGAIPEPLLESELFGHERGAFTGAIRQKPGLFEVAEGGTVFLDEVGDVTPPVQVKLLQAIEEKAFHRVGGTERLHCDVRILAATHRDLESSIREGAFREDLYYRLNVFPITLPPLRDRREDLPLLVEHFLRTKGVELGGLRPEAMKLLFEHAYPGNIREMQNLLERALILSGGKDLGPEHFPTLKDGQISQAEELPEIPEEGVSMEDLERRYIRAALVKAQGNKSQAARLLGMTRRTLYSRMERHGIPV